MDNTTRLVDAPEISAERYKFLVEESGAIISTHRPGDWAYTAVNSAVVAVTGYSPAELMGKPAYFFFHPDDAEAMQSKTIPAIYAHGTRTFRYRYRHRDGHYLWLESTQRSIRDPDSGELLEIISISRDMSRQKEAEQAERDRHEELAHADRLMTMGEMATGLAHEINQPLATILNYSRGGIRRIDSGRLTDVAAVAPIFASIARQAQRAADIIKRLRSLAKKSAYQRSRFSLNDLCLEVLDFLNHDVVNAGVTVDLQLLDELPSIQADTVQIEQVLINLLRNAIEATLSGDSEQRVITIATAVDGSDVLLSVSDCSGGLSEREQDRLFEPFYTTKASGLGMGLSIVRSIVEAHAGSIRVLTDNQTYTTFEVRLPAAQ